MQVNLSTILLTTKSITTTLQTNGLHGVKIESTLEDVMLLSDSNDDGTHVVDLAIHSTSPFKSHLPFTFAPSTQDLPIHPALTSILSIYLMHSKSQNALEDCIKLEILGSLQLNLH